MKHYKLAILFTQPPFGISASREGLDALLAASAFCDEEEIAICFLFDGVWNIASGQQPNAILQKDHIAAFKLLDLYELHECFACEQSLDERRIDKVQLVVSNVKCVAQAEIFSVLSRADKVLTF